MEILITTLQALKPEEIAQLKKKYDDYPVKRKLINQVIKQKPTDLEELINFMNYENKRQAFYTLKHRIIEDIIDLKVELKRNKLVELKQKIGNLRLLLYSENPELFLKLLEKLKKQAEELELIDGSREIHFCYWISEYCDEQRKDIHASKITQLEDQERLILRLEQLFYTTVFESPDLYYYSPAWKVRQLVNIIRDMKRLHERIKTSRSEFLYLSAKLSHKINHHKTKLPIRTEENILRLMSIYIEHSIPYYYPDCKFAILTLLNKFYHLSGNIANFKETLVQLNKEVHSIKGYRTYESVYFYFLYINILHLKERRRFQEIPEFINQYLDENLMDRCSNRYRCYFNYIKAVGAYYSQDTGEIHSRLLRGMNYKNFTGRSGIWLMLEIIGLKLYTYLIEGNDRMFDYELNNLKKWLVKIDDKKEEWASFLKFIKDAKKLKMDQLKALIEKHNGQQKEIFKLIDLEVALNQNKYRLFKAS